MFLPVYDMGTGFRTHVISAHTKQKYDPFGWYFCLVGAGGFGPPKSVTTDLQSAPFGRSGTLPYSVSQTSGAGGRIRTPDLLITNQLLYQLSYTSVIACLTRLCYYSTVFSFCQHLFLIFSKKCFEKFIVSYIEHYIKICYTIFIIIFRSPYAKRQKVYHI